MGQISSSRVVYGLFGTGTPTDTNVSGSVTIGKAQTQLSFDDGNILYSFQVTSTGATDVATLTISSGSVAQTTGTPTITDGDGKDFSGATLGTLATPYMLLVEPVTGNDGQVRVASSVTTKGIDKRIEAGETYPLLCSFPASGTIAITFAATGDSVKVTVLGKTA